MGRSRRMEPAKLCKVCMEAWSRSWMPRAQSSRSCSDSSWSSANCSRLSLTRSLSSDAAASVKVIAAILSSVVVPVETSRATLSTRLVVLPVPAPASTKKGFVERKLDPLALGSVAWGECIGQCLRTPVCFPLDSDRTRAPSDYSSADSSM